jgi:type VII secretion protein EccE
MTPVSATQRHPAPHPIAPPAGHLRPSGSGGGLRQVGGHPGQFGRIQLVGIEIAVLACALAVFTGAPAIVAGVCGAAFVVLLAVFGRVGGYWVYQMIGVLGDLRRRRRAQHRIVARHATSRAPDRSPVALLAPSHRVVAYQDRGGEIGIGQDERGWFAVMAVNVAPHLLDGTPRGVRFERLISLLDEGTARPSAVQFVALRVAAPTGLVGPRTACLESYAELLRRVAPAGRAAPAEHLTWIAVRLDAADAADAAAERGGGPDGVYRAVAAVIGRLGKLLGAAGGTGQVLDAAALTEALVVSCGLDATTGDARSAAPAEHWHGWQFGGLHHAAFEVGRWPAALTPALLDQLVEAPVDRVVVSTVVRKRGDNVALSTIVRVAAAPARFGAAIHEIRVHATSLGVRLRPVHGLHRPAIYASAPTGGGQL